MLAKVLNTLFHFIPWHRFTKSGGREEGGGGRGKERRGRWKGEMKDARSFCIFFPKKKGF